MIDQQAVPLSKRRLAVIWIITCGGSTLLAGLLGLMATLLYVIIIDVSRSAEVPRLVIAVGGYVGLGVGLLAGCGWCWMMVHRYQHTSLPGGCLYGARCGAALGAAATIVLHGALMAASSRWNPGAIMIGMAFGLAGGGILGALCTLLFPRRLTMAPPDGGPSGDHP